MEVWSKLTINMFSKEKLENKLIVKGQVLHRRKVSKKLFFFDLRLLSGGENILKTFDSNPPTVSNIIPVTSDTKNENGINKLEVIVRYDEISLEEIPFLWRRVRVGDIICVDGFVEVLSTSNHVPKCPQISTSSFLFHCLNIESLERFSSQNPFTPEPPLKLQLLNPMIKPTQQKSEKHCKYWLNSGKCQLGDLCPYLHMMTDDKRTIQSERKKWIKVRKLERRNLTSDWSTFDPHSSTEKVTSSQRARTFAEWLLKTFGQDFLSNGSGVLDIAGGRGDVSFYLQTVSGVKCTLIDPRERKNNRKQLKLMRRLVSGVSSKNSLMGTLCDHMRCEFDDDFIKNHSHLINKASILIGMHPDQVTEYIIQTAISHNNKPFAVVPCCVFGHLFPNRLTVEGEQVLQFDDFVSYLMGLSRNINQEFLNFEGRNLVMWKSCT